MTKVGDVEVPTPELDKMATVRENSQVVGEFLDWLLLEKGVMLGQYHEHDSRCYDGDVRICGCYEDQMLPASLPSHEQLLAEFFDIDLKKVEQERRAILDALRRENGLE